MIQDILVWTLFAAIVIYAVVRWIRKPKHDGCSKCEFNPETQRK